ncbi:MAG TPA: hypothetical protein VGJ06_05890 [Candidatus Acidoferrum sp.]|jgi:hypothetical protein
MRTAALPLLALSFLLTIAGCKSGTAGKVVTVTVDPTGVNVVIGKSLQFNATVTDTFNTAVTWTVSGGSANGSISSSGLYTAPATVPTPAQVVIIATSEKDTSKTGTATVTITTKPVPSNVTVLVSPLTASISSYSTQLFTATVTGSTNTNVTWLVNGQQGGSRTVGFISSTGFYVAPGNVPTASDGNGGNVATTLTVTAVSSANTNATASSTVTIVPGNQNTQSAPIELGTSGGNGNDSIVNTQDHTITCCGGTLGSLLTRGGTQYILSNNHVLARADTASIGDPIVQPGLIDAGLTPDTKCDATRATTVANLSEFVNLESQNSASSSNIDAAIAQVVTGEVDPLGNILFLGGVADSNGVPVPGAPDAGTGIIPTIGLEVAKSGRSTGLTCSSVLSVNIDTSVEYNKSCDGTGAKFTVEYNNQVDVTGGDFAAEGDSGSLIVSQNTADPVALLYAGSDSDVVGNPVSQVLAFFSSGGNPTTFVGGGPHAVIGCTLPSGAQAARAAAALAAKAPVVEQSELQRAVAARDARASALLAHPAVQAVGVGASLDNPGEPAIEFFVTRGMSHSGIPAEVNGIRTRIVEGDLFSKRGAEISAADSATNERAGAAPRMVYSIAATEMVRASTVKTAHAKDMMKLAGVQGVGVTSSVDAPGEAALMVFVIRGVEHAPIPAVIDGLRTRVRESSRFRAGNSGAEPRRAVCHVPAAKPLPKH